MKKTRQTKALVGIMIASNVLSCAPIKVYSKDNLYPVKFQMINEYGEQGTTPPAIITTPPAIITTPPAIITTPPAIITTPPAIGIGQKDIPWKAEVTEENLAKFTYDLLSPGMVNSQFENNSWIFDAKPAEGNAATNSILIHAESPIYTNGKITTTFKMEQGEGRIGVVLFYQDKDNNAQIAYDAGRFKIIARKDGKQNENIASAQYGLSVNTEYTLTVQTYEGKVKVTLKQGDSETVLFDFVDITPHVKDIEGKFGYRVWGSDWGSETAPNPHYGKISVSALATDVNTEGPMTPQPSGKYELTFDDISSRGGWKLDDNSENIGQLSFVDGIGKDGYMFFGKKDNDNQSRVFAYDDQSPKIANGYIEANMTNKALGRIGLTFRYVDSSNFQRVSYDVGQWSYQNASGKTTPIGSFNMQEGVEYKVRVEFIENEISLIINDQLIGRITPDNVTAPAGHIGTEAWGWQAGGNQGKMQISHLIYNEIDSVSLSPKEMTIKESELESAPVNIGLSSNHLALTSITQNDEAKTVLALGTDYTMSDDNKILTLTPTYLEKIKQNDQVVLEFKFENEYTTNFTLNIAHIQKHQKYSKLFATDIDGIVQVMGNGTMEHAEGKLVLDGSSRSLFIDENSLSLKNQEVEFEFDPKSDSLNYGIVLRYSSPDDYVIVAPTGHNGAKDFTYWSVLTPNAKHAIAEDGIRMFAKRNVPYKVRVRLVENVVTVYLDGAEVYSGEIPGLSSEPGKVGFFVDSYAGIKIDHFSQETANFTENVDLTTIEEEIIASESLTVKVDKNFPRVIEYNLEGVITTGQVKPVHTVEINNKPYNPTVTSVKNVEGNQMTYTLTIEELGVCFDVTFEIVDNVLDMRIINVQDSENPIYTFNFPEHSLVSMASDTPNAELRVNDYRKDTIVELATERSTNTYKDTSIAVLSNDNIAATINNGSIKNRAELAYQTFQIGDQTSTGLWSNEYLYRGMDGEIIEEPWTKVAIARDRNKDNKIDFQDGAIARREDTDKDVEHTKMVGADFVTDSIGMIAMNVGSEAQYPFLRILDNMKKVSLGTDGFSQNLVIKGYQSEGHDSSHPEFAKYNQRAGGLDDLNILLEEARKLNSTVGVHINHRDIYPESYLFEKNASSLGAWGWYDSARHIIRENDLLDTSKDGYDARYSQLATDTKGNLGLVYVDVFFGTRWPMHKVVKSINETASPVGTEYVDEMVRSSTWAHHIDGRYNTPGNLVRFISNDQQDIFGNSSLFRGARTRHTSDVGINGWQSAKNYNEFISAFYQDILPNKYLAQFPISQYESNDRVVLGHNNEVVSEMINGKNVITKGGKKIADGNLIFIPWDEKTEEKIYHWNNVGGTTTWELPDSWRGVSSVYMYPLTDEGRGEAVIIDVVSEEVTINAAKNQGYIICKASTDSNYVDAKAMDWGTGSPVKDMGFDSHSFTHWEPSSTSGDLSHVNVINNELGNTLLKISGTNDAEVTQTLTGLIPGQSYSVSVFAEVEGGKTATIEITSGDEVISTYMEASVYNYGMHHSDKYLTKAQRMGVHFVAQGETAIITLKAGAAMDASAWAEFDDVRVMKNTPSTNDKGYLYFEDFENVDQGHGVFVSNESDHSHLAEKNRLNPEHTNTDIINGDFSLKVQGGNHFRTMPHTVRFKPNTKYEVGIKYKTDTVAGLSVSASTNEGNKTIATKKNTKGGNQADEILLVFTTDNFNDYFIEIKQEKSGTNYRLDDFYVREVTEVDKNDLIALHTSTENYLEIDYTPSSFQNLELMKTAAQVIIDKLEATQEEIQNAYDNLKNAIDNLDAYATNEEIVGLQVIINTMKALPSDEYIQDAAWNLFVATIASAEELVASPKPSSKQVANMITSLNTARENLISIINKVDLKLIVDKSNAVDTAVIVDDGALKTFLSERTDAEKILKSDGYTQEQVDASAKALTNAYNKLTLQPVEGAKRVAKMSKILSAVNESDYTPEEINSINEIKKQLSEINVEAVNLSKIENLEAILESIVKDPKLYNVTVRPTENGKVAVDKATAKQGETVTITATANENYKLEAILVDGKALEGNTFEMPAKDVAVSATFVIVDEDNEDSEDENGSENDNTSKPEPPKTVDTIDTVTDLVDIKGHWAVDAINLMVKEGLFVGVSEYEFNPNAEATRAMMLTVLYRSANKPLGDTEIWYEKAVEWAKAQKISDGTNLEDNVTREQFVTMLYRMENSPQVTGNLSKFKDTHKVSSYATNALIWGTSEGIIKGNSNGTLNPKGFATRAELATMLDRYINK